MNHSIATIIHYCTNDYRFLRKSIEEAKRFSKEIIIPVCDHFFNGQRENRPLLERCYQEFPECQFIEFKYDPYELYHPHQTGQIEERYWSRFWHSTSRYIGALFASPNIEYLLFLDADEIVDGKRFVNWLDTEEYRKWNAVRLQAYVYVHQAALQANDYYPASLLTKLFSTDLLALLNVCERYGYFHTSIPSPKIEGVLDQQGKPLIHHYTWVRTKEECLHKSTSWGYRFEKDWSASIERMFTSSDQNVMDLNLTFKEIEPFFDPLTIKTPEGISPGHTFSNVIKVDHATIRRKEILRLL